MNREQTKKKIIRRLLGTFLLLAACVAGGSMIHAPRTVGAAKAEVQAEAAAAVPVAEGAENDQFIVWFIIGLIAFVVIVTTVISVVSAISSASAAIAEEMNEED